MEMIILGNLDFSGLTPALFVVYVVFITLIGSAISFAIVRMFQQKYRSAALMIVSAIALCLLLYAVVQIWFI